jgi:hypothetical protein
MVGWKPSPLGSPTTSTADARGPPARAWVPLLWIEVIVAWTKPRGSCLVRAPGCWRNCGATHRVRPILAFDLLLALMHLAVAAVLIPGLAAITPPSPVQRQRSNSRIRRWTAHILKRTKVARSSNRADLLKRPPARPESKSLLG